ncbi:MAG TPA: hypothetical protein VFZ65_05880 [Planctomycetota bacterium]|nr:hypothetical protein [Planctomycetota bacterium]
MNRSQLFSSLFTPILLQAALLPAQNWSESGDAGQLLRTAQTPQGFGPLASITGSINNDADLYVLQIDDPLTFSASTVGGATIDTQLFLFDVHGRGVVMNDDSAGTNQSTITGQYVPSPGRYYLAISCYDRDPIAIDGEIWNDQPYFTQRQPDGARAREQLSGWNGTSGTAGAYTILLTGAAFPAQQLVLPDNHNLSENASQLGSSGSTNWWRAGGGRFQLVYDASHFATAGVAGPIAIRKLMFRGEDGEPNRGGAVWNGVFVQVGATSLTSATMTTNFVTNRGSATTTLGPPATTDVTMQPSSGATPNDYNIVIDLTAIAAGFPLDPTSSRPNLLIDIIMPSAATVPPASGPVMAMQDTSGGLAVVRGRGVTTATSSATTGTDSTSPPVLGLEFVGNGGSAVVVPARNELYGAACGGEPSAFYQSFVNGQDFDLGGLRMLPNDVGTPVTYSVQNSIAGVDASKVNAMPDSTADDALVTHNLGFTFRYPGGSTTTIRACTNGFVWLDGTSTSTDFSPSVAEFLGAAVDAPARLAPFWYDFNCGRNTLTHPNSGLHVMTDTSGGPGNAACYVTWLDVGVFNSVAAGGTAVHRMQCVLHENGTVEYRYGAMPVFCASTATALGSSAGIVGFTRGRIGSIASADPQSRDLSVELPFTTFIEGGTSNIGQTVVSTPFAGGEQYGGRAFAGQSLTWNVDHVPAGTLVGVQLLDIAASRPGFALPTITAPGCMLSTTTSAVLWDVHVFPSAHVAGGVPLVIPAGIDGFELYAQYVVLGGLFGAPDLITSSSNAVKQIVGRN